MRSAIRALIFRLTLFCVLIPVVSRAADTSAADLLAGGRVDEAIALLQKTATISPTDPPSFNLLCRAYYSFGDWDKGISACEKAVAFDPNSSMYHLWLGRVYGEKADNVSFFSAASLAKKASVEFETAVKVIP